MMFDEFGPVRGLGIPMGGTALLDGGELRDGMRQRAILICEGSCNPRLKFLDARLTQARDLYGSSIVSTHFDVLEEVRRSAYTLHYRRGAYWECEKCRTPRKWGAPGW